MKFQQVFIPNNAKSNFVKSFIQQSVGKLFCPNSSILDLNYLKLDLGFSFFRHGDKQARLDE